jgi:cobalt-zinc-cadmium efflux system protein
MKYEHTDEKDIGLGKAFKTGIFINIVFISIELLFGFLSNSMALIADAGHNFSDVMALIFSLIAIKISRRKPTIKFTYGFRRSTIFVAVLNTFLLLAAVIIIFYETIKRISRPAEINASSVIIVAFAGIVVNAITALLFMKRNKQDLNVRSVFLHFLSDALVSAGVVIGGIIILITGFKLIDSLISFVIGAVILYSLYKLLIDSVNLALDAVPENINIEDVLSFLGKLPEVNDVHDLHIWALSTSETALTVHLVTSKHTDINFITSIQNNLREQFNIEHTTIQVEFNQS